MTTDTTEKTKPDVVRSDFMDTIREVNQGRTPFDLTEGMEKVVAAVGETGKPGKLVYTMYFEPVANTDGRIAVSDNVDPKPPKPDRFKSLFFKTRDNRLIRENPNQMKMDLED